MTTTSGGGAQTTMQQSGEWPDLSGKEVHFLTEESGDKGKEVIRSVNADFEEATGATVNTEFIGIDGFFSRLTQLIQAGNPPEVSTISGSDVGVLGTDTLATVDSVIDSFEDTYGELPDNQRQTRDGNDYFLPFFGGTDMYWYREDIAAEPYPETWDDALELARKADGQQELHGTFVSAGQSICTEIDLIGWGYTNGASTVERRDGQIVSTLGKNGNKEKWIETLDYMKQLHQYSPEAAQAGCGGMINAIPNRVAATGPYYGARPKIQAIRRDRDFAGDMRAALFPRKESHKVYGNWDGYGIYQDANTKAARTYMKFAYQPEYLSEFLWISPLQNLPPGNVFEHESYQTRLENDLPDAWSEHDIEMTIERAEQVSQPNLETSPPNTVAGALTRESLFSRMKFDAIINEDPLDQVVDTYHEEANSILSQAQNEGE
jgi:ABC-type glycerol-3-phosphate transport system substrate-binding protein